MALALALCIRHSDAMRTHAQIITDGGGYQAVASKIPLAEAARVRFWLRRDSIPGEFWAGFAKAELATLEELAVAAEARRAPQTAAA